MRIAICDDENHWVEEIKERVLNMKYDEVMEVKIDCFNNQDELLEKAEEAKYNLVYLDIEMEGKNGIEVAKELMDMNPTCTIVFVTAYDSYVNEAFEVSAFQYLRKPIDDEYFNKEFVRAIKNCKKKNLIKVFKIREGYKVFNLNEIISIESYYNDTIIRTIRGTYFTNYENLRKIRKEVLEYDFIRVQAGFIINMNYITSLKYREITLVTGKVLPVSMHSYRKIVQKYNKFLSERQ